MNIWVYSHETNNGLFSLTQGSLSGILSGNMILPPTHNAAEWNGNYMCGLSNRGMHGQGKQKDYQRTYEISEQIITSDHWLEDTIRTAVVCSLPSTLTLWVNGVFLIPMR